ncbi:MurR/RpiR family transcriptional regulator [Paenibacillus hunanensis]|uniref:DNA-binding MurR/RpiR family transcriptional regulator n=1 Tax=Paenibacillus hunanensis TaxID=539262 RepID=A0ABU1J065_9BACL|nr:MurR/RpiR family transcriptional regulator [Paenibacillus hunanensis]MCL9661282.1 MurR/RpiR family transcriptional regulator [Paenibacillus hunanensis]MDR6243863.1 DNA-binding MurR/RpiR family transcriptional regulator [Paenibacillus hunanensis]GGJ25551.1 putative HTH-type transcriptional regulator [Paenibacillus hunanensis]
MSPILHVLEQGLGKLSPQERRLANYILQQPSSISRMGITQLATQCGISPATVTRFCKTFHFEGFPDFKMKLAAELAQQSIPGSYQDIIAGNPLSEIVKAIESNHVSSINDTTRLLSLPRLEQAIGYLIRARRIDLYGIATSSIVAQDFYQKLIRIGKNCTAFADSHMQITSASTLSSDDVAIAISYSGETKETIDALTCAKENGATTLSLTQYSSNPLADIADIALFSSSLEKGIRRGDMASRIAQLHIIDILFTGMISAQFNDSVKKLELSYKNVRRYRKDSGGL